MGTQTTASEIPIGPNVARAWFDTVIRPLLIGLEEERKKLRSHEWGWEPNYERLDCARDTRGYLDYQAWKNLEQLFDYYPDVRSSCDAHDNTLAQLVSAFREAQGAVENSECFAQVLSEVESYGDAELTAPLAHLLGDDGRRRRNYFAAYVLNGHESLYQHYVLSPIWNRFSEEFLALRETPDLRSQFAEIDERSTQLLKASERLYEQLDLLWREISRRLDVPYYQRSAPAEWAI